LNKTQIIIIKHNPRNVNNVILYILSLLI